MGWYYRWLQKDFCAPLQNVSVDNLRYSVFVGRRVRIRITNGCRPRVKEARAKRSEFSVYKMFKSPCDIFLPRFFTFLWCFFLFVGFTVGKTYVFVSFFCVCVGFFLWKYYYVFLLFHFKLLYLLSIKLCKVFSVDKITAVITLHSMLSIFR